MEGQTEVRTITCLMFCSYSFEHLKIIYTTMTGMAMSIVSHVDYHPVGMAHYKTTTTTKRPTHVVEIVVTCVVPLL